MDNDTDFAGPADFNIDDGIGLADDFGIGVAATETTGLRLTGNLRGYPLADFVQEAQHNDRKNGYHQGGSISNS